MYKLAQHLANLTRSKRGASAVEFAIIAPLFLTVVFGIIIYGSYLTVVHGLDQLAAEAARASVAGLSDSERSSLAQGYVTSTAATYPLIAPAHLTINAAAAPANANVFVVTLNYDASRMFIYSLPGFVPVPSPNMVSSAAIQRGGF
jgi:Flp pilus assembly protein TadG